VFRPAQLQSAEQGFSIPQHQVIQCPNNFQTPAVGSQNVQRTHDPPQADCMGFNCGEKGHYANRCPNPCTHANHPTIATPAPTRGANFVPIAAKQNYACGRVNHVDVEEAQALYVVIGMFLSMMLLQL
jgi:hypothetical protein